MPEGGHDAGDHPPITPTALAREGELTGDSWRLYEYITRHFIATLMPNQQSLRTKITFVTQDENREIFVWTGSRMVKAGFTAVMPWRDVVDDYVPEGIKKGDTYELVDVRLKEGLTSPPPYLTESDLISLMEKLGIGTDASMAVHINNICERRYVQVCGSICLTR